MPRRTKKPKKPIIPKFGATASVVRNEMRAKLRTNDAGVADQAYRLMSFRPEGFQFMPQFKRGIWDGYKSLYSRATGEFPGGLAFRLVEKLVDFDVNVSYEDRSVALDPLPALQNGSTVRELRQYQEEACDAGMSKRRGVFDAATGLGKTEIMSELTRRTACKTLIVVASRDLAHQTIERFQNTLSFPQYKGTNLYGIYGDGIASTGLITAALFQTLQRRMTPFCTVCGKKGKPGQGRCTQKTGKLVCAGVMDYDVVEETQEWLRQFDAVHLDEAHHVPAITWWPIINACPAYWRFGYSATPFKSDKATELKLVGATGEVVYEFKAADAIEAKWLTKPVVTIVKSKFSSVDYEYGKYTDAYRDGIVEHFSRNMLIADIAYATSAEWQVPTLILVQWLDQGSMIRHALQQNGLKVEFISGHATTTHRQKSLKALGDGSANCLISTVIFDEGIDVPEIGALILAGGGKAEHRVVQRIGRGLRVVPGKEYLAVFDFWDDHSKFLLKHSRQRLGAVEDAGFETQELTVKETLARIKAGDIRRSP